MTVSRMVHLLASAATLDPPVQRQIDYDEYVANGWSRHWRLRPDGMMLSWYSKPMPDGSVLIDRQDMRPA